MEIVKGASASQAAHFLVSSFMTLLPSCGHPSSGTSRHESRSSLGLYRYANNPIFNQLLKKPGLDGGLPRLASGTGVSRLALG